MRCRLEPSKRALNDQNSYNHNYRGLYCICDRPYPDSEDDSDDEDEMVQCIVCEDWFHYKVSCVVTKQSESYSICSILLNHLLMSMTKWSVKNVCTNTSSFISIAFLLAVEEQ